MGQRWPGNGNGGLWRAMAGATRRRRVVGVRIETVGTEGRADHVESGGEQAETKGESRRLGGMPAGFRGIVEP